jgi:hypothetical protein
VVCKLLIKVVVILGLYSGYAYASDAYHPDSCHPAVSQKENNYIIGYGSLIQKESRQKTNPNAKYVYPIEVKGFKRVWGIQGGNYKTTFLTLLKDENSSLNAVYYSVADYGILETDEREMGYCRILVPKTDIQALGLKDIPDGKYWVYAQKDNNIQSPSKEYPIVQSYVDIFLDGCIQVGDTYNIPQFLEECISKTHGWPTKPGTWVNDRQHPRRPFGISNAFNIDKILSKDFKDYYQHPID